MAVAVQVLVGQLQDVHRPAVGRIPHARAEPEVDHGGVGVLQTGCEVDAIPDHPTAVARVGLHTLQRVVDARVQGPVVAAIGHQCQALLEDVRALQQPAVDSRRQIVVVPVPQVQRNGRVELRVDQVEAQVAVGAPVQRLDPPAVRPLRAPEAELRLPPDPVEVAPGQRSAIPRLQILPPDCGQTVTVGIPPHHGPGSGTDVSPTIVAVVAAAGRIQGAIQIPLAGVETGGAVDEVADDGRGVLAEAPRPLEGESVGDQEAIGPRLFGQGHPSVGVE